MTPIEVDDVLLAFPADITHLMPNPADIPVEFGGPDNPWRELFSDLFYAGVTFVDVRIKEGIDARIAMRHIRAIMGSFEPAHEDKERACAYLFSEWFESITYESKGVRKTVTHEGL